MDDRDLKHSQKLQQFSAGFHHAIPCMEAGMWTLLAIIAQEAPQEIQILTAQSMQ